MSAMESMIKTILKAMDLNPDVIQREVTSRIAAFEGNVQTLNATLIAHHASLANIETNLRAICAKLEIPYAEKPTAKQETENGSNRTLPAPS